MAEIKVEREPGYGEGRPRNVWPIWLAGALGVAGLLAVLTMTPPTTDSAAVGTTTIAYQGQTLTNRGMDVVNFPDGQMVKVGTSQEGIELYRHQAQAGGGGGVASRREPVYMKHGDNSYILLQPVEKR